MQLQQLKQEGVLVFTNEHQMEEESFELEVHYGQLSSWDAPFKVFVNGELKATFKSFAGMENRVNTIIKSKQLQQV